ncbi:MAG: hypothetical protein AAF541_04490 [Pseudomonadota bacterium]
MATFSEQIDTFGFTMALKARIARLIRRLFDIHVCTVFTDRQSPHPPVPGYTLRMLDYKSLQRIHPETAARFRTAFEKGDVCAGAIVTDPETGREDLAAYNMYSLSRTHVDDQIDFEFPENAFCYSYGTFTFEGHRGKRVAPSVWSFARDQRYSKDIEPTLIFYIAMTNLSSLKAGDGKRKVLGYCAFKPGRDRAFIFNSPACKRQRVGFVNKVA